MSNIIAFSGLRSSGKTTSRNYVMGLELLAAGVISRFSISDKGELVVPTVSNGELVDRPLLLDQPFFRSHPWANQCIYPVCKNISFAYELRVFCRDYLGIREDLLFGSYENKNKETQVKWATVPKVPGLTKGKTEFMTVREVLEYFGGLMRQFNPTVWLDKAISQIKPDDQSLLVIDDVRYPNELEAIQALGGKVVRLTRQVTEPIDGDQPLMPDNFDWSKFDVVIDNSNTDIHETNLAVHRELFKLGVISSDCPESVS